MAFNPIILTIVCVLTKDCSLLKLQACKPTTKKNSHLINYYFQLVQLKKNQIAKDFSNKKLISILPSLK